MYDVNVSKIKEILKHTETLYETMVEIVEDGESAFVTDSIRYFAGQRILQLAIESVTDVGTLLIDGFIMRDPGSYQDIVEIMLDEKVVSADEAERLIRLVSLRKPLTQEYVSLSRVELFHYLTDHAEDVRRFAPSILSYLKQELGV
jgi:uncharacterized protein YutE (UPF0331/DUF86 family)